MRRRFSLFSVLLCLGCFIVMLFTTACRQPSSSSSQTQAPPHVVDVPDFNADSAFAYVERQVAFGPRVPNTPAHRNAAEYLATELRRHGAQVVLQDFRVRAYDGTMHVISLHLILPKKKTGYCSLPIGIHALMPIMIRSRKIIDCLSTGQMTGRAV